MKTALMAIACMFAVNAASAQSEEGLEADEDRQHFALFLGGTSLLNGGDSGFTIGGDYEYRVTKFLGLGVVAEHAFEEVDSTTILGVADLHFGKRFAVQVGPGVEITDGNAFFAGRVGILYEIELGGGFTLSPQAHVDISEESSIVFGIGFGRAF